MCNRFTNSLPTGTGRGGAKNKLYEKRILHTACNDSGGDWDFPGIGRLLYR